MDRRDFFGIVAAVAAPLVDGYDARYQAACDAFDRQFSAPVVSETLCLAPYANDAIVFYDADGRPTPLPSRRRTSRSWLRRSRRVVLYCVLQVRRGGALEAVAKAGR